MPLDWRITERRQAVGSRASPLVPVTQTLCEELVAQAGRHTKTASHGKNDDSQHVPDPVVEVAAARNESTLPVTPNQLDVLTIIYDNILFNRQDTVEFTGSLSRVNT